MINKLAFSEAQQAAVLGYAIKRPEIFSILEKIGVAKEWFISNALSDLWSYTLEFRKAYKKWPLTWDEVVDAIKDEDVVKRATRRTSETCTKNQPLYQWEILEQNLLEWAKARIIHNRVVEIAQKYNDGKHDEAFDLFHEGSLDLQKQDAVVGLTADSFISSAERVRQEETERLKEHERILPYGIPYLQDALTGILPSDVVLLGADTGIGKTEAAKILAAHVAKVKQLPVHFFALEAENNEIERRIKYGLMGGWYKEEHLNIPSGMITYKNWRYNRLENEFAPYKQRAQEVFEKDYRTLHTYYACRGLFGLKDLEREIYKVKNESALIVLDHLHYMDLGDNENLEMTRLVRGIKDMSQILRIPFILVCHIRKRDNKGVKKLVPDLEDFHGTSNISKICTQAVMLAPAWNFSSTDSKAAGKATFVRAVKVRVDGSALYHTGVCFFDLQKSCYGDGYALGHLNREGNKWTPSFDSVPYWADRGRLVVNCGEVT